MTFLKHSFAILFLVIFSSNSQSEPLVFTTIKNSVNSEIGTLVMTEAYGRLGIDIIVKPLPASRALKESNDGNADGELYRISGINKKWSNLVQLSIPINQLEAVAFTKNLQFKVSGWDSLRPYKLSIRRGVRFSEIATEGMTRQIVNDNSSLFKMVNVDRADIAILALSNGLQSLKDLGLTDIKPLSPAIQSYPLYHYLHSKHKDLLPKVEAVLMELEKEGFIQKSRQNILDKLKPV